MLILSSRNISKWGVLGQNGLLHKSRERQAGMQTHKHTNLFLYSLSPFLFSCLSLSHIVYPVPVLCVSEAVHTAASG